MKSFKIAAASTLLALAAVGLSGCSTAQKGAAAGGLVGGAAGSVFTNNWAASYGPATGAAVGATGGAAVGGIVGDAYDQITEADKERELQNLRAELDAKERELAALRAGAPSEQALAEAQGLRDRISELQNRIGDLENQLAQAQSDNDSLRNQLADSHHTATEQASQLQAQADQLRGEIDALQAERTALRNQLDDKDATIAALESELEDKTARLANLENQMSVLQTSLSGKEQALEGLKGELDKLNIQLEETSRGLTMTIVNSLLYQPGSSELTTDGRDLLGNVARILKDRFPNRELLIEGHTDDQPIVHSGWRSNWELGAARALTILHELVDGHGLDPSLISASSYGEFRPSAANTTAEGQARNRRAVIVILPEKLPVQRESLAQAN